LQEKVEEHQEEIEAMMNQMVVAAILMEGQAIVRVAEAGAKVTLAAVLVQTIGAEIIAAQIAAAAELIVAVHQAEEAEAVQVEDHLHELQIATVGAAKLHHPEAAVVLPSMEDVAVKKVALLHTDEI
jgi:TRAP-type mannitol/chloroaromatic compound transport system substrate-binding protein